MSDMLRGKRIVVTGAAQGIGATLARGFCAMGARVVLADIADPEPTATVLRAEGYDALAVTADITDPDQCAAMVAAAEDSFGGLDGLVNNAALFAVLPIAMQDEITPELWDSVMAVNVKGSWLATRAAVPAMDRSGGGSIVMFSSNRVFQGYPGMLHYDASKGAVLSMARSLTRELGPKNIRVNTIAPGLTMTEAVLARDGIQDRAPAIAAARSLARDQVPEDLIGPCAFFLSDHSAFVSGQSLGVDGGGVLH